jgi:hypothetical protein
MDSSNHLRENLPPDCADWLDRFDDLADAWRDCPRAEWLLSLALAVDVERSLAVHAAADIASAALAHRAPDDPSAGRALKLALGWIEGRATSSEAWASGFSAMEAADRCDDPIIAAAMRGAAFLAFACDDRADAVFYAHRGYAAKSAEQALRALDDDPKWATHVRARIPLAAFIAAFRVASQPPPPLAEGETEDVPSDGFYI